MAAGQGLRGASCSARWAEKLHSNSRSYKILMPPAVDEQGELVALNESSTQIIRHDAGAHRDTGGHGMCQACIGNRYGTGETFSHVDDMQHIG
jgi:hypothetical protein